MYEVFSGQAVNYQKSAIFFSSNVRRDKQEEIKDLPGVFNGIEQSKYLGLPSLIGKSKKIVFRYLKDKVWQKIQGWNTKLLSREGCFNIKCCSNNPCVHDVLFLDP